MKRQNYLSWEDVNTYLKDLRERHQIWARVEFGTPVPGMSPNAHLVVKVIAQHQVPGKNLGWERCRVATWPTYGHKTMVGLIMRLVYELDTQLDKDPPKPRKMLNGTHFPRD